MAATIFDLQRLAETLQSAAYSAVTAHPLCHLDADGFPATRLTGDESGEFVAEFQRDFLPLVAAWKAAREAVAAANRLDATELPTGTTTAWSECLDALATAS